jgi:hypothetical protein
MNTDLEEDNSKFCYNDRVELLARVFEIADEAAVDR